MSRPVAFGVSFRRLANVARPAGCRGVQDRPSSREDADEVDGDRGALSPSAYDEARAGAQDLSVSAARHRDRTAKPGVTLSKSSQRANASSLGWLVTRR